MLSESWLYNLIIYSYALSVLFYFSDYLQQSRMAKRIGSIFLAIVWLLMTLFLVVRMFQTGTIPIVTLFETLFFYAWLLVTVSFIINLFFRIDLLVFFINVIGFVVVTLNFFSSRDVLENVHEQLISELLIIHITISMVSYVAFSLAAIFAIFYIIQHRLLKAKKWNSVFRRLPSLELLEVFFSRFTIMGIPMLLLGIILGIIWAYESVIGNFWLDPKVIASLVVILFYSIFLYRVFFGRLNGIRAAYFNLICFIIVLVNYVLSVTEISFHRWI